MGVLTQPTRPSCLRGLDHRFRHLVLRHPQPLAASPVNGKTNPIEPIEVNPQQFNQMQPSLIKRTHCIHLACFQKIASKEGPIFGNSGPLRTRIQSQEALPTTPCLKTILECLLASISWPAQELSRARIRRELCLSPTPTLNLQRWGRSVSPRAAAVGAEAGNEASRVYTRTQDGMEALASARSRYSQKPPHNPPTTIERRLRRQE
jgi:hypothetical protein